MTDRVGAELVPETADRRTALPALTGLRMVGAFLVYTSHVGPPHSAPLWLNSLFNAGYMGVTLFFTLSGFVLALNYFESMRQPTGGGLWQFAVGRFSRIYPLYLLMFVFMFVNDHLRGGSSAGWWQTILAIQTWSGSVYRAYGFDGPSWSIGVEVFLYACFPLLVMLLSRVSTRRACLVIAVLTALAMFGLAGWFTATGRADLAWTSSSSAHRWLYRMPLTRLGDFILGILAARLYQFSGHDRRVVRSGGSLAAGSALIILGLMLWWHFQFTAWSWDAAYAVPSVVLIFGLAVAPRSTGARLLSLPTMVLLGEASFAFYLIHQPALAFLNDSWNSAMSLTVSAAEVLSFGAILCLAVGVHVGVERPARVYLRRFLHGGRQHLGIPEGQSVSAASDLGSGAIS